MSNIITAEVVIWNNKLNQPFTYMVDSILYKELVKNNRTDFYGVLVLVEFNNSLQIGMITSNKLQTVDNEKLRYQVKPVLQILAVNKFSNQLEKMFRYLENELATSPKMIHKMLFQKNNHTALKLEIKLNQECQSLELENEYLEYQKKYFRGINKSKIEFSKIEKVDKKITVELLKTKRIIVKLFEEEIKQIKVYANQKDKHYLIQKDYMFKNQLSTHFFNKEFKSGNIISKQVAKDSDYLYFLDKNSQENKNIELNQTQKEAYQKIVSNKGISLLHGVTGSGKTSVFIKLIANEVEKGNQVLVLVPEITLTLQMIEELNQYFRSKCAYFNNTITKKQHQKLIKAVHKNEIQIIIGTRSSIFLEIPKLNLVIIDEEQDSSYKQDSEPYYHVDVMHNFWLEKEIKIVLSSATPRLKTYAKAQKNLYQLVEMSTRYNDYKFPRIKLQNYDQEHLFNDEMLTIIQQKITNQENVLILFNVKGYSKNIVCQNCGMVPTCPNCKTSLKYFKASQTLECGFCTFVEKFSGKCSECLASNFKLIGIGIEQAQEVLEKNFAENVLRIDGQVAKSKQKLQNIITEFKNSQGKILIGTQIIAKGLNFPGLDLVVVLNTDRMLFFNDYNAQEQVYQLLEQVSGRSGRTSNNGEVYIYTNYPNHQVYQAVVNHDYQKFYQFEMRNRKLQKVAPYYYMAMIEVQSLQKEKVQKIISQIETDLFKTNLIISKIIVPYIQKINNYFRLRIYVKYQKEKIKALLEPIIKKNKIGAVDIYLDLEINNYKD